MWLLSWDSILLPGQNNSWKVYLYLHRHVVFPYRWKEEIIFGWMQVLRIDGGVLVPQNSPCAKYCSYEAQNATAPEGMGYIVIQSSLSMEDAIYASADSERAIELGSRTTFDVYCIYRSRIQCLDRAVKPKPTFSYTKPKWWQKGPMLQAVSATSWRAATFAPPTVHHLEWDRGCSLSQVQFVRRAVGMGSCACLVCTSVGCHIERVVGEKKCTCCGLLWSDPAYGVSTLNTVVCQG